MDTEPFDIPSALPVAQDLYCLYCAYNLRGQSGDPRRCPECGHESSVEDMRIPAEMIHKQARKLETLPAVCVGAVIFWVELGFPLLILPAAPGWLKAVGALSGVAAIVVWLASARAFASNCRHQPGWHIPILELHAAAALFIGPFAGLLGACGLVAHGASALALATVLVSWTLVVLGVIVYRDARRRLAVLQRKTAAELARKELAKPKYLRRFPSGLPRDRVPPGGVS